MTSIAKQFQQYGPWITQFEIDGKRHGGQYLASHDRRVIFGLGRDPAPARFEIRWPSGIAQQVGPLAPGRYHDITEPAR